MAGRRSWRVWLSLALLVVVAEVVLGLAARTV
jgi:hypothetical protein